MNSQRIIGFFVEFQEQKLYFGLKKKVIFLLFVALCVRHFVAVIKAGA